MDRYVRRGDQASQSILGGGGSDEFHETILFTLGNFDIPFSEVLC